MALALPPLASVAIRRRPGTTSRKSSSPLAGNIGLLQRQAGNVASRSGQARNQAAANRVSATANTIGIADVACFTAGTAPPAVTMTSTLSRTNSAAISG